MSSPDSSTSEEAPKRAVHTQLRPRKTRSKTGCTCCRLRKKKCDERHPTCGSCMKLGLICSWIDAKEFAWRKNRGLSGSSNASSITSASSVSASSTDSSSPRSFEGLLDLQFDDALEFIADPQPTIRPSSPGHGLHARYLVHVSSLYDLWPHSLRVLDLADPVEQKLLQSFIEGTSPLLLCLVEEFTPTFVHQLLDWAFKDSLIMNGVLAVATSSPKHKSGMNCFEAKRLQCYGDTVKELKLCLTKWDGTDAEEALRLLTTTYLLTLHEWIQGNELGTGSVKQHLRASRQFANVVLENAKTFGSHRTLVGLVLEQYAYFELCSNFCLPPSEEHFDIFWHSPVLQLDNLRQFQSFGALFGCFASLYQLIPSICQLAVARQAEIAEEIDLKCYDEFERINCLLQSWIPEEDKPDGMVLTQESIEAGRMTQIGIQLFLYSAFYTTKDAANLPFLREFASPLVDETMDIARRTWCSPWSNTNYWFVITAASYATGSEQQTQCLEGIPSDWPLARTMRRCLYWMWARPDEEYGFEGLTRAQEALHINVLLG